MKLQTLLEQMIAGGLTMEAESCGTSQNPSYVGRYPEYRYSTVWVFTIRYDGRQDSFEKTLPGTDEKIPSILKAFRELLNRVDFSYTDFGEWASEEGLTSLIQSQSMTVTQAWNQWKEIQEMKKRYQDLFGGDLFEQLYRAFVEDDVETLLHTEEQNTE